MGSQRIVLYCTALLTAISIICTYFIYVGGLRYLASTAWQQIYSRTDTSCIPSNPGIEVDDRLVVLRYAGVNVGGPDGEVTVTVRRQHCTRRRTCIFTGNRRHVNYSNAIIFSDMIKSHQFPSYRPSQQKWIFRTMETPVNEALSVAKQLRLKQQRHEFNATSTYARFSDVPTPYFAGICRTTAPPANRQLMSIDDRVATKDRAVAWFATHCWTSSKRERYVTELRRYIDVDVFGGCGQLKCPLIANQLCLDMLERRYFFYLAFENSLCADYVTEKFWLTLRRDVVAVVLGAANYTQLVPPGSHLDVRDFRSPRHLADRLRALMTTDTDDYADMLRRKRRLNCLTSDDHDDEDNSVLFQARLCRYLDATENETRTTDLQLSWNARYMCTTPRSFYRGVADMIAY